MYWSMSGSGELTGSLDLLALNANRTPAKEYMVENDEEYNQQERKERAVERNGRQQHSDPRR
jgi:hypothetical protein